MRPAIFLTIIAISSLCLSSCICAPTDNPDENYCFFPIPFAYKVHHPDYSKNKKINIALAVLREHGFKEYTISAVNVTGVKGDKYVDVKFQHDFLCFGTKVLVSPYGARYPGYDQDAETIADEIRERLKK